MKTQRPRFTLIELLVVIAIIAILAAMLMPALQKAKQNGLRISCLSNLKQQSLAWQCYWGDNDGYFPDYWPHVGPPYPHVFWFDLFAPYEGDAKLWYCPAHVDDAWSRSYNHLSYGYNHKVGGGGLSDANLKVDKFKEPCNDILIGDSEKPEGSDWVCLIDSPVHTPDRLSYRHLQGINFLWADGHAEWRRNTEVIANNHGSWNVPSGSGWYGPQPWFRDPVNPVY